MPETDPEVRVYGLVSKWMSRGTITRYISDQWGDKETSKYFTSTLKADKPVCCWWLLLRVLADDCFHSPSSFRLRLPFSTCTVKTLFMVISTTAISSLTMIAMHICRTSASLSLHPRHLALLRRPKAAFCLIQRQNSKFLMATSSLKIRPKTNQSRAVPKPAIFMLSLVHTYKFVSYFLAQL